MIFRWSTWRIFKLFEHIKHHYGVKPEINMRVTVDGKSGIIITDKGHYIGVNFDSDKPGVISNCHPTWRVEYFAPGKPRKQTRSQARYQRFLEYGDMFESFMDFVYWDMEQKW